MHSMKTSANEKCWDRSNGQAPFWQLQGQVYHGGTQSGSQARYALQDDLGGRRASGQDNKLEEGWVKPVRFSGFGGGNLLPGV